MGCETCPNNDLAQRVNAVERDNTRITAMLEGLERNIGRLVQIGELQVRLEERQIEQGRAIERAFQVVEALTTQVDRELDSHGARLSAIEKEMPTTVLARGWVFAGIVGVIALLASGLAAWVVSR